MRDIVCISHLRWDFVWQRPQQLLSRLGANNRILFVEEPVAHLKASTPTLETYAFNDHITVVRLVQPVETHHWLGHGDPIVQSTYSQLLSSYLLENHYTQPVLWLYTPMALDFVDALPHELLVFDVMDQLSAFKGAPTELVDRDKKLLVKADLVLTGGISLYRDKQPYNTNTHMFPSGVDIDHFGKASTRDACPCPVELRNLLGPIVGYFGVIDERIDLDLLAYLAQSDWNLVMIGPVAKINPAELPQAPNLHYLGMKSYDDLPNYLAYFDVALIPFALNEATRYLSPTKTLEYMAAHRSIVSTPIHDVVELYGEIVRIGDTPEAIRAQIETALNETAGFQRTKEDEVLARYTWDHIAQQIGHLIELEIARQDAAPAHKLGKTG